MRDIQISRPVLIVLVGAVLVGGLFLFKQHSNSSDVAAAPPANTTAATGATGAAAKKAAKKAAKAAAAAAVAAGATGATGGSGATGSAAAPSKAALAAERKKKARADLVARARAAGMPTSIYSSLKAGKIVLIYFWNPKASDDQETNDAVNFVKSARGSQIAVTRDQIDNKSNYNGIAQVADITQTPGIVLVYKGSGTTWQGYIDGTALNGQVTRLIKAASN